MELHDVVPSLHRSIRVAPTSSGRVIRSKKFSLLIKIVSLLQDFFQPFLSSFLPIHRCHDQLAFSLHSPHPWLQSPYTNFSCTHEIQFPPICCRKLTPALLSSLHRSFIHCLNPSQYPSSELHLFSITVPALLKSPWPAVFTKFTQPLVLRAFSFLFLPITSSSIMEPLFAASRCSRYLHHPQLLRFNSFHHRQNRSHRIPSASTPDAPKLSPR